MYRLSRHCAGTYLIYCSDLLYFFARYLAEALLGILTKDSSLLYLVMLHGVSQIQKSLSLSTRKSRETKKQSSTWPLEQLWQCHEMTSVSVCLSVPVCVSLANFESTFQIKKQMALSPCWQNHPSLELILGKLLWSWLCLFVYVCVCVNGRSFFLTKSWVSTFFVQLRGAVRCIACSQSTNTCSH